jgi:hypothetical protein
VIDARMGGDDQRQVGIRHGILEGGAREGELREAGHVRVVVADLRAQVFQQRDDLQRGRLAHIPDAGLVADAHDRDPRAFDRHPPVVERALGLGHAVVWHLLVDLAGQLDELGRHVELRPAGSAHPYPDRAQSA